MQEIGLIWLRIGIIGDPCEFGIDLVKPKGKRPLGRLRHKREDNIRMDLKEIGVNTSNWVDSAQDRDYWRALVNAAFNLLVP